jgi:hypothetical protein
VAKISSEPVSEIHNTSPDSKWVAGFGQEVGEVVESIFAPANPGSARPFGLPDCSRMTGKPEVIRVSRPIVRNRDCLTPRACVVG